jgi:hypothetical protein
MSNSVWVKWLDPLKGEWLFQKVRKLADDADVADMCLAFVEQLEPDIRRLASVEVREKEEDKQTLKSNTSLTQYFVSPETANSAANSGPGPGMSMTTALFLTFPPPSQQQNTVSGENGLKERFTFIYYSI